jgi:hypothetical protein
VSYNESEQVQQDGAVIVVVVVVDEVVDVVEVVEIGTHSPS